MSDPRRCSECGLVDEHTEDCPLDLEPLPDEDLRGMVGRAPISDIAREIISPFAYCLDDADVVLLLPRIELALKSEGERG